MYGKNIFCGISNGTFEIPHIISYPYIEKNLYNVQILRAICFKNYTHFERSPRSIKCQMASLSLNELTCLAHQ